MAYTKEELVARVGEEFSRESAKLDQELANHVNTIALKRASLASKRARELALLDLQFCADWNALVLQGAKAAYAANPSYQGRKTIVGQVPFGDIHEEDRQLEFEARRIQRGVLKTFDVVRECAVPIHTIDGIVSIIDERVTAPDHTTFSFNVLHDLPTSNDMDFVILAYRGWLHWSDRVVQFSIDVSWQSKTIPCPPTVSLEESLAGLADAGFNLNA